MENDLFSGEGHLVTFITDKDNNKFKEEYKGEWLDGEKHGYGVLISKDGKKYEG
jgi:MORN repeat